MEINQKNKEPSNYKPNRFIRQAFNITLNKIHAENTLTLLPPENQYFVKREMKMAAKNSSHRNHTSESEHSTEELSGLYILNEINNLTVVGMEDGRESNYTFQRLHVADIAAMIFSLIGLALGTIAYDISFVLATRYTSFTITIPFDEADLLKNLLLIMVSFSTFILGFLTIIRHKLYLNWMKSKKMALSKDSLWSSGQFKWLMVDIIIILMIPYPFFDNIKINNCNEYENISTFYLLNDLLSMAMFMRIIVVVRVLLANSSYYSNSSHRLCRLYECQCSYVYVIKCLMKKSPLQLIWGAFFLSVLFFGYLLKISERPLNFALRIKEVVSENYDILNLTNYPLWNASNCSFPLIDMMTLLDNSNITSTNTSTAMNNDLTNYANDIWLMIVTMTTVGYGDYVPKTISGRVITFIACMIGLIAVSLMTIILQNILTLNTAEARSLSVLEKLVLNKERKRHSAFVLTNMAKLGFFSGKLNPMECEKRKNHIGKIKYHMDEFRNLTRSLKDFNQITSYNEEMTRHFSNIRDDIKSLEENINSIAEKTLQVLEQKNILKLNDEPLESLAGSNPNIENNKKDAHLRALRKLIKWNK